MRTYGPSWRTLPRAIPNRDRQSPTQYSPDTTDTYLSHRGHWPLERTWRPVRVGAARTGGAEVCLDPPGDCPPLLLDHVDSPGRLTDDTSCILGIFQLKSLFYNNVTFRFQNLCLAWCASGLGPRTSDSAPFVLTNRIAFQN